MTDGPAPGGRPFGPVSLSCLVVANMIGAGVFTTSGLALGALGSPGRVMAAWAVGGLVALAGAISYGGLVRRIAESGGEYVFLSRAIHPMAGFVAGWISLLAGFTGAIAFAALAFEAYMAPLAPVALPANMLAIIVVLAAAALHGIRVGVGVATQNILVMIKLVLICGFLVYALVAGPPATATPGELPLTTFSVGAFAATLVWVSLSYSGFNAAVYVAGEASGGGTGVSRALWSATLLVTLLYLALNAVIVYLPPVRSIVDREDVAAAAALAIGGQWAAVSVRVLTALGLVPSVFSMVAAGPRVYARMAADGLLPRVFRLHGTSPAAAVALQAGLALFVVLIADLRALLSYLGFTLSLSAAATVSALFVLRHREGSAAVTVAGYPVIPALFVAATLIFAALAARRSPGELLAAVATIGSGCLVYAALQRYRGRN